MFRLTSCITQNSRIGYTCTYMYFAIMGLEMKLFRIAVQAQRIVNYCGAQTDSCDVIIVELFQ